MATQANVRVGISGTRPTTAIALYNRLTSNSVGEFSQTINSNFDYIADVINKRTILTVNGVPGKIQNNNLVLTVTDFPFLVGNVYAQNTFASNTYVQSAITTLNNVIANSNIASFAEQNARINANITAANARISTLQTSLNNLTSPSGSISQINANVAAANLLISSLQSSRTASTNYIDDQISRLVAGAPVGLNTIGELATSLGNDASFVTTYNTAISSINSNITAANLAITTANTAMKSYVDSVTYNNLNVSNYLASANISTSGNISANYVRSRGNIAMTSSVARNVTVSNVAPTGTQGNIGDIWYQTY